MEQSSSLRSSIDDDPSRTGHGREGRERAFGHVHTVPEGTSFYGSWRARWIRDSVLPSFSSQQLHFGQQTIIAVCACRSDFVLYKVEWCMRGRIVNIFRLKVTAESTKSAFVEPPQKPFVGGIPIGLPPTTPSSISMSPLALFLVPLSVCLQATSPIGTKAHVSN